MMSSSGLAAPSWPTDSGPQQHGIPPDGQHQDQRHTHVSSLPARAQAPSQHYVLPNPGILPPPQNSMVPQPPSPYQPTPSIEATDGRGILIPPPYAQPPTQQQQQQQQPQQQHQQPALMRQPVPHSGLAAQPPPPSALPPLGRAASSASATASTSPAEMASVSLTPEQLELQRKNLQPYSSADHNNRKYELVVVQQPSRARMCGFGDKDRRPITPPPCVKLIVTDTRTGREIDVNNITYSMFVMTVDLRTHRAELGPSHNGNPNYVSLPSDVGGGPIFLVPDTKSRSSTTPASFTQVESAPMQQGFHMFMSQRDQGPYMMTYQTYAGPNGSGYVHSAPYHHGLNGQMYPPNSPYYNPEYRQEVQPQGLPSPHAPHVPSQAPTFGPPRVFEPHQILPQPRGSVSQPQGMFTRNLIGSLSTSAFRLNDTDEKIGIWFVLQDLSVRTEGKFRLRFSFVDVSPTLGDSGTIAESPPGSRVYQGKAPILASVFSESFTVYSAKKFPGVCESTQLSKSFASQGIKIPIRKEGASGKNDENEEYES